MAILALSGRTSLLEHVEKLQSALHGVVSGPTLDPPRQEDELPHQPHSERSVQDEHDVFWAQHADCDQVHSDEHVPEEGPILEPARHTDVLPHQPHEADAEQTLQEEYDSQTDEDGHELLNQDHEAKQTPDKGPPFHPTRHCDVTPHQPHEACSVHE
jgi:hypothetical protein